MATGSDPRDLLAVIVYVQAKAECIDAFKAATVANATNSVQEKGCARFDVVQEQGDPTKFAIMEVFK